MTLVWLILQAGVEEFKLFLEGVKDTPESATVNMSLYTIVYNMCTQKTPNDHSKNLYTRYQQIFDDYIRSSVLPALKDTHDEFFLRKFVHCWKNHKLMVKWMKKIFNYLDRYYVVRYNLVDLHAVGVDAFKSIVYEEFKVKAREAVLAQMEKDREGEIVDTDLLRDTLAIFQEVGMGSMEAYENDFEVYMLQSTEKYYRKCAMAWIAEDTTPDYLRKAETRLLEEEARVDKYLHVEGKSNLLREADATLLQEYETRLLEKPDSGLSVLLSDERTEDITRMFRLFSRLPDGLEPMAKVFKGYIEEKGSDLIRQLDTANAQKSSKDAADHTFIKNSISLHDTFTDMVSGSLDSSPMFHKALREAFESFFNKTVSGRSVPELMALFADAVLRKGGASKLAEDDMDGTLDKLVKFLAYISDRDMFAEFYRKKLARRLLYSTSCGEDAEKGMLTRLKQQCGQQFTSKMEGMVQDLQIAREKEQDFRTWLDRKKTSLPVDMNVTVLTTGYWPSYKALEMELPEKMVESLECFARFHEETAKSRRLTWQLGLGSVHLKATFGKSYELILSPVQAAVLLSFDVLSQDTLSFQQLRDTMKIPDDDLSRSLHSLCLGKYKLLLKSTPEKKILATDSFSMNDKFVDRARRIRIPLPPVDDRRKVHEEVDKDRKHAVDAAIVRIMKSRKTLSHSDLMGEVITQLQRAFHPDVKVIKKSIEGLIDREYIERDSSKTQTYKYIA